MIEQKIARLKETAARKIAEGKAQKKAAPPDRQLKLELWPDEVRGVPNAILRGALFGVGQERIVHKKRTLVAAVEGYEIRFKGETFAKRRKIKQVGMATALQIVGLELEGEHHRALADARNIARLLPWALG